MRFSGCEWRINCCGIFCTSQEGGEGNGKIPCHISSQNRVPCGSHVQIFWSIQKRLLCLCPSPWQTRKGCSSCQTHRTATGTQLPYLRIPSDVALAEKSEDFLQSKNCTANYEEV